MKTTRTLVREDAKRPTVTLKGLLGFLHGTDGVEHVSTAPHILHMYGLRGRLVRWKPFLTKTSIQALSKFCKKLKWGKVKMIHQLSQKHVGKCFMVRWDQGWNFLAIILKGTMSNNTAHHINNHGEARWWQHPTLGAEETMCSSLLDSWGWISPFSTTIT